MGALNERGLIVKITTYKDSTGIYGLCIVPNPSERIQDIVLVDNSLSRANVHIIEISSQEMFNLGLDILNLSRELFNRETR